MARITQGPVLFRLVLGGFLAGIGCGIFFGERVAFLEVAGQAYVRLLQMAVIPYVLVSITSQLGRLSFAQTGSIALKAGLALLFLWLVGLFSVLLVPIAFPEWPAASFFSISLAQAPVHLDLVELYIPDNPFYALAHAVVPGVVVFSLAFGSALIAVENKAPVLSVLSATADAIMNLTRWVVALAPLGVFALTAYTAGTIRFDELARFQVYVWTQLAVWAFLMFWAWPRIATVCTPVGYRELFYHTRSTLLTAFATGSLLVVLPMLADQLKSLLAAHGSTSDDAQVSVDVLVPTVYNLPNTSMLLTVGFVFFATWFTGTSMSSSEYPTLVGVGAFTAFGGTNISVPFMLDLYRLPADLFELFLVSDALAGRFWTALGALFIAVLCILVAFAIDRRLRVKPLKLVTYLLSSAALAVATLGVVGLLQDRLIDYEYTQYDALVDMQLIDSAELAVSDKDLAMSLPIWELAQSRLALIRNRGSIRVAYLRDRLPFAFRNKDGNLVGLDIEMAHALARTLGVGIELIQTDQDDLANALASGRADIVMSGTALAPDLARQARFSNSYMDQTLGFVVEDHRRHAFTSMKSISKRKGLRLAVADNGYFATQLAELLPNAQLLAVDSPRRFFRDGLADVDALVFPAEAASAWTLVYPDYAVVIPQPATTQMPLAYLLPDGADELQEYVNLWLELKSKDGSFERYYRRWILGDGARQNGSRWSIIDDVLHWAG